MPRTRRPAMDPADGRAPAPRRVTAEAVWYASLTVVFALLLGAGVIAASSVSPRFCLTCHGDAGQALAGSAHAGVACDSCHVTSGTLGLVEQRLRVVSMVAGTPLALVSGRPVTAVPHADNAACTRCHAAMLPETFVARGVRMNHRAPDEQGWLCVTCHRGVAHPGQWASGTSYSMDMCLRCHSAGPQNLTTCEVCHPQGESPGRTHPTAWGATHGPTWRSSHGMGDLSTCKVCHAQGYCVACHNMELPHPPNYLVMHGRDVVARPTGDADCVVCHTGSACQNCHGVEMPHPDGFLRDHVGAIDRWGPDVCARCHDQSACDSCHERHIHPGIPSDLLEELQRRPVSVP